jgi:hypothetical protein
MFHPLAIQRCFELSVPTARIMADLFGLEHIEQLVIVFVLEPSVARHTNMPTFTGTTGALVQVCKAL